MNEEFYRRRLPHYTRDGATYFVTWRIYPGSRPFDPRERQLIFDALKHFDGERYDLFAAVVMDDHVHVLVMPRPTVKLKRLIFNWKSFTANALQRTTGRVGSVWQDEAHDRIMRDEAEFIEKVNYTFNNPAKRWEGIVDYPWLMVKLERDAVDETDPLHGGHGGPPHH